MTEMPRGASDPQARIYENYVSSGAAGLAPTNVADFGPRMPYLRTIVRRFFPSDKASRILDLGCGYGALLYAAREQGYINLAGCDFSAEQVAAARASGIADVQQADLFDFIQEQADGAFDFIITYDVIEHLRKPELVDLVDDIRRALKPDGRWLIHAPNAESPLFGRIRYGDFTHEMAFTRTSLTTLLRASGFQDVECFEDPIAAHGIKSSIRVVCWKLIRAALRSYVAVETGDSSGIFTQNLVAVARK